MIVLKGNHILDLVELGANPWVALITVRMKASESTKAIFWSTVVNQPSRNMSVQQESDLRGA